MISLLTVNHQKDITKHCLFS